MILAVLACLLPEQPPSQAPSHERPENNAASGMASPVPTFVDRTLEAGLAFSHHQREDPLGGLDETLGPGACAFDYDDDGWVDLFLVNGSGQTRYYGKPHWWQHGRGNALFRNRGGARFEETTDAAGLRAMVWGMGCVTADFDNDGDVDLWVTTRNGSLVYRNDGGGRFVDITALSGVRGAEWSTTAAVADYDGDGLLDVYVANYVDLRRSAHTFEAGTQYADGLLGAFSGELYEPQANRLYRNLGNLRFQDVAVAAGVDNKEGRGLGAAWFDANGDRRPDLLVANDRGLASNALFLNQGRLPFKPAGLEFGLNSPHGHRGIALGDLDGDGALDVAVASARGQLPMLLLRQPAGRPQAYVDQAREWGVAREADSGLAGWTPGLQDFDNDGRLDLFMANGLALPDPDARQVPQGQPNRLWLNRGPGGLEDVSRRVGPALGDAQSARGAAFADFDNDGDIDIYVAHNNDMGQLLVNTLEPGRHWLGVRLVGGPGNRDAVGARVQLRSAAGTQVRTVLAGGGFASDSERRAHFGLGGAARADRLVVEWPDGLVEEYPDPPIDRYLRIRRGAGRAEDTAAAAPVPAARAGLVEGTADERRRYLRLAVRAVGAAAALPELAAALADPDPATRTAATRLLGRHKVPGAPALLAPRLEDPDPGVAEAAARSLCGYEDEASVRWLLRGFRHPVPGVRQAVAECFADYFREEEAVVERKYLALPFLIGLLGDPDPAARVAALRALGDAERYRAVDPVLEVLETARGQVQAEAARALGLIRERKADPGLRQALAAAEADTQVRAQALVALKRLDPESFGSLLGDFLDGRDAYARLPVSTRLEALRAALSHSEGVVLDPSGLVRRIVAWAERTPVPADRDALALAALLGDSGQPGAETLLGRLARDTRPAVRAAAYRGLLRLAGKGRAAWAGSGLRDTSLSVRLAVLDGLKAPGFPAELPGAALLAAAQSPATQAAAIPALRLARDRQAGIAAFLADVASAPATPGATKIAALEALAALGGPDGLDCPGRSLRDRDPGVRLAALACWSARRPAYFPAPDLPAPFAASLDGADAGLRLGAARLLVARPEAWAQRAVARRLADPSGPRGLRRLWLRHLPADNAAARQAALAIARDPSDPLRYLALRTLARLEDPALDAEAWRWLREPGEPLRLRLAAARLLARRHGAAVLEPFKPLFSSSPP